MRNIAFDAASDPIARRVVVGLGKVGLALRSRSWKESESSRLTPTQAQILTLIHARWPGGVRVTQVAEELGVTPQTASSAVAALVAKGHLRRGRAPEDGRGVTLGLTARGRRQAEAAATWPDFLLAAVDTLSHAEQEALLHALIKMIRALQVSGEISVARLCVTCRYFRPNAHRGSTAPHHCAFVDAAFGVRHLRLDCPEHDAAPAVEASKIWRQFQSSAGVGLRPHEAGR